MPITCPAHTTALALSCLLCVAASGAAPEKPAPTPTAIQVKGSTLTFDPKTCNKGQAQAPWGLGSVQLKILGRKDGRCRFELRNEVEGGFTDYLCQVPVDGGPVSITAGLPLKTSFGLDKCEVLGGGNMLNGSRWRAIQGTKERVHLRESAAGRGLSPKPGDVARVRLRFFADNFVRPLKEAKQDQVVEIGMSDPKAWGWARAALAGMNVGGKRNVWFEAKVADGLKDLLPPLNPDATVYVQIELLSARPAKGE
jgi:hypothetical protein